MGAESKRSLFTGPDATVSLIIPCWKDVEAACALARSWAAHSLIQEVIIAGVQGHGLSAAGDSVTFTHSCRPGRGRQMNDGAAKARGDVLLFHHVDSTLTTRHVESLVAAMRDPAVVGGAFYRKFDERHPFMQWAVPIERWHSRTFGALFLSGSAASRLFR
jgi:hypothetical protein